MEMTKTTVWTKETIRAKLSKSDVMVERSILKLYSFQTADEKATNSTEEDNGQGFNGVDASFLTSLAKWIEGGITKGIPEGKRLSEPQRNAARKALMKYAGQLIPN